MRIIYEIRADWYATKEGAFWETYRVGLPVQRAGEMVTVIEITKEIDPFGRYYRVTFEDGTVIDKVNVSHIEYKKPE